MKISPLNLNKNINQNLLSNKKVARFAQSSADFCSFTGRTPKAFELHPLLDNGTQIYTHFNCANAKQTHIITDKYVEVPQTCHSSDPIWRAWEDDDLNYILRSMQFNGGEFSSFLKQEYENTYRMHVASYGNKFLKKFPTSKDYIQYIKQKVQINLEMQKLNLEYIKPLEEDCVFYRGVNLGHSYVTYFHDEFVQLMNSLKKGQNVVLDWASMCTTNDFDYVLNTISQNDILRIKAPKGSKVATFGLETRFPSKAEFKFLNKKKVGQFTFWDFEYIS